MARSDPELRERISGYHHWATGLTGQTSETWATYDRASEQNRHDLLWPVGPPAEDRATVVTWRVPFDPGGFDLRFFDAFLEHRLDYPWKSWVPGGRGWSQMLLAVELLGPEGPCAPRHDDAVLERLDDLSYHLERLWGAALTTFLGYVDPLAGVSLPTGERAPAPPKREPLACLLIRPDGVVALHNGLPSSERGWLEMIGSRHVITVDDLRADDRLVEPKLAEEGSEAKSRRVTRSRALQTLWQRGVIHLAAPAGDTPLPRRAPGDRRPFRVYHSALGAAASAARHRAWTQLGRSEFTLRQHKRQLSNGMTPLHANAVLRERLDRRGLLTI